MGRFAAETGKSSADVRPLLQLKTLARFGLVTYSFGREECEEIVVDLARSR
jgi:hypothetical protein